MKRCTPCGREEPKHNQQTNPIGISHCLIAELGAPRVNHAKACTNQPRETLDTERHEMGLCILIQLLI